MTPSEDLGLFVVGLLLMLAGILVWMGLGARRR